MCRLFVCCHLRSELVFPFCAKRKEEEKLVMWKDRFSIKSIRFSYNMHKRRTKRYENAWHNFMHELRYAWFQDAWEDEGKTSWSVSSAFFFVDDSVELHVSVTRSEHKWKVIHEKCDTCASIQRSRSFFWDNLFYFVLWLWNIKLHGD